MVSGSDVKYRKASSGGIGGQSTGTSIVTATDNNAFDEVTQAEQVGGHIEYRCMYIVNSHATEKMEDCDIWLSEDNPNSAFSTISWAIDPISQNPIWPFTPSVFFDGVNQYLDCGNHASLWSQALTKFSFSFWLFPTAAGDGNDRLVIGHGGASNQAFRVFIDTSSSVRIRFQIKNSVGTTFTAYSDSLNLNKWNHIVCTYDNTLGSQNMKVFVDNILGAQTASLTESINVSAALIISDSSNDYQGYVKDFRWYTTKALTVSQIDDIFQGQDDAVGPDYWLKFSENTGNPVDSIGAKTTTLTNGAAWRTSQAPANNTTSPVGITWLGVTNGPIGNTPNLGTLAANVGTECPIWVRWTVQDTDQDADPDFCVFTVQGKIPQGGTGGSDGGGGEPVPPPVAGDFTFAVSGDWGTESMTTTVVNLIKNNTPTVSLVCGVGDNAYDSGSGAVDDWLDRIKPIDTSAIRFETAFGNHDNGESESSSNETAIKNHFGYSNTYFSFDIQNVHFLFLDNTTETSFGSGSAQNNFAKTDLAAARNNPDTDWIVVIAHKPMFGGNSQHSYNDDNFNQAFFPMFDQYKVDLMCFGHNHHMAQSKQVKYNSNDAESPTIVDSATPYTGGAGRVHVISGAGGHDAEDLYEVASFSQTEWSNDTEHGALFVTITNSGSTSTMTGVFKSTDSSILRTFVINR